ncbi:phosphoglucomutase-2-like [Mizuhopecten yessoensis]|uniref:phosphoglucomutase-2-like n=1 Tax=Mizuhopecten yessoensis TaxID=6573 RepID=UPI000B459DD0|nr:phosphoglucomutase-2-like [Mizuhopecten yessoensis]
MAKILTGDVDVDAKVEEWMDWDKNETTREEILKLAKDGEVESLKQRLLHRMEFGTAGLRARMGAGYSMMNDLTIIQTTQGLCKHLLQSCPTACTDGVVIGYDGRHNSDRFAKLATAVFINKNVPVYLFSRMCPTPYVAYGVLMCKAACGIMVTASHNPKEDNGYKVYWGNGSQIISPHDKGIASCILESLEPLQSSWQITGLESSPLVKDPYSDVYKKYNEDLSKLVQFDDATPTLEFTYTAMHGVGYPFIQEACRSLGHLKVIPVLEQVEADPDFPTVKYPNPEEGKGALKLAMATADAHNCPLILANDPDADRLAVAVKRSSGDWHIFSGNELGALFGWWSWTHYRQKHPDTPAKDIYMLASTVSSKILGSIASKEGFHFVETLTGFKWMGNKAHDLLQEGKTVLFAFEEAIGFMCGSSVLDKDGVSAAVVMGQMVLYLQSQGLTLYDQLTNIYQKYGFHLSSNSYYICHDTPTIEKMFVEIRKYNGTGKYPESCGQYKIKYIRDLTVGHDNSQSDGKPLLPVSKSSQMITFTFENGCVATLRTSGTEPKIKYYTEHRPDPNSGMDRESAEKELEDMVQCIIKYFYQPEKFGFIARTS